MSDDSKVGHEPLGRIVFTAVFSAFFAALFSLGASYIIAGVVVDKEHKAQMERASNYADKLEAGLEIELKRKWEDYRADSVRWLAEREDSASITTRILANNGGLTSGMGQKLVEDVKRHFDELIADTRLDILRLEQDKRLEIETIRETGVLLK